MAKDFDILQSFSKCLIDNGDGTYSLRILGVVPINATVTGATQGSVLFVGAGGALSQDNANLFFNDTTNRLGVGTASPPGRLSADAGPDAIPAITARGNAAQNTDILQIIDGAGNIKTRFSQFGDMYNFSRMYTADEDIYLGFSVASNRAYYFSATSATTTRDGAISRLAANKIAIGNAAGDSTGTLIVGVLGVGNSSPSVGLEVGATTAGLSAKTTGTLGAEMAPAISAGNWTLGSGWSISSGQLIKVSQAGNNSATPSGTFTVVAGRTYKVVITNTASVLGNNYLSYTIGGTAGSKLTSNTTITDYLVAATTGVLTFSDVTSGQSITITAISVKELTPATGDLTVDGALSVRSLTTFVNPVMFGINTPALPTAPLVIMTTNNEGIRIYRTAVTNQYISINESDGSQHIIETVGDKPLLIKSGATSNNISIWNNGAERMTIGTGGNITAVTGSFFTSANYYINNNAYIGGSSGAMSLNASGTNQAISLIPSGTGDVILNSPARLKAYTVATLPAGVQGQVAFVTDALAPTFLATVVGGGAVVTPVFYNGTNWVGS